MAEVRDPDSWRRFSRPAHEDEHLRAQKTHPPAPYVPPSARASIPSPPRTPTTKEWPLKPAGPPSQAHPASPPQTIPSLKSPKSATAPSTTAATTSDTYALLDLDTKETRPAVSPPKSTLRKPPPAHPYSHRNGSQLTLGFSGRPASRFKFWTQISSDPTSRDSWLESQQRKKRHRTWICWAFWLCLLVLVAGVVVCVLLLKDKHII